MTIEEMRAADVAAGLQRCRVCGCTDNAACDGGCCWVEKGLCSECADAVGRLARRLELIHEVIDNRPGWCNDTKLDAIYKIATDVPPPPSDSNRDRKLKWREACDGGAFWWITGDADADVMLSEDEHFAAAAGVAEGREQAAKIVKRMCSYKHEGCECPHCRGAAAIRAEKREA